MKHSNQIAYIRQLSSLGLAKEAALPHMLAALSPMVPACFGSLLQLDQAGQALGPVGYSSREHSLLRGLGFSQREHGSEFLEQMRQWFSHTPVLSDLRVLDKDFYQSRVYHELLKPNDVRYVLMALIPRRQGLPLLICLSRRSGQRPFNAGEVAIFKQLLTYFEKAANYIETQPGLDYANRGEQALVIAESDGTLRYACASARRLLFLACASELDTLKHWKLWLSDELQLPQQLLRLCNQVQPQDSSNPNPSAGFTMTNGYGEFHFQTHGLQTCQEASPGLIGINVHYRQPAVLSWLNALKTAGLSPMQREVGLLLAQGKPQEQIASSLNLKVSSVKDYTKKIYSKLHITRREEFLSWLTDSING